MSLSVKNYKEVSRSFFNRILLSNGTTGLDEIDRQVILSELEYNGFNSHHKYVIWWRIHYNQFNRILRIEPIYDNWEKISLSQNYLLVPRSFIIERLSSDNENYFNEYDKRIARIETECKGFYSYN